MQKKYVWVSNHLLTTESISKIIVENMTVMIVIIIMTAVFS